MSTNDEREALIPRFYNPEVGALATVLFEAFKLAEPEEGISKYPAPYMATFADMAHAGLVHLASLPAPAPAVGETEGMADLLTKAIGDITAALTLAGRVSHVAMWTAPYVEALNEFDEKAPQPPEQCANIAQKSEQSPAPGGFDWRSECEWLLGLDEIHVGEEETEVLGHIARIRAALANHSPDAGGVGKECTHDMTSTAVTGDGEFSVMLCTRCGDHLGTEHLHPGLRAGEE